MPDMLYVRHRFTCRNCDLSDGQVNGSIRFVNPLPYPLRGLAFFAEHFYVRGAFFHGAAGTALY
jgi:hypothetical protein